VDISYGGAYSDSNGVGGFFSYSFGPLSLAKISSPTQLISVAEETKGFQDYRIVQGSCCNHGLFAGHTGFSNYLFADGHVKALRPQATLNEKNDSVAADSTQTNMWTIDNSPFTGGDFTSAWDEVTFAANTYK